MESFAGHYAWGCFSVDDTFSVAWGCFSKKSVWMTPLAECFKAEPSNHDRNAPHFYDDDDGKERHRDRRKPR